jgi:hypothetical protein
MANYTHIISNRDLEAVENFTELQTVCYTVPDYIGDNEAREVVVSPFSYPDRQIITYSSESCLEMEAEVPVYTIDNVTDAKYSSHTYKPSLEHHRLMNVYATLKLPQLVIKEEYIGYVEICYAKNLMHNIISNATIVIPTESGEFHHTVNSFYLDCYRARDVIGIQSWDYMIGNRKELIEWNSELTTEEELALPIPFFTDAGPNMSIPIHMFREHSRISIKITNCVRLQNFLRMRIKDKGGKWVNVKPCLDFIESVPEETSFQPKIWGRYRNIPKDQLIQEKLGFHIKITDIRYFEPQVVSKSFSVRLTDDKTSVRGLRFAFLNLKSAYFNDLSNYSFSHQNRLVTPLETYALSNGNLFRIKQRDSIHLTAIAQHYSMISACDDFILMHDILFDFSPYNTKPDTSIIMREECVLTGSLRVLEDNKNVPIDRKLVFRLSHNSDPESNIQKYLDLNNKYIPEKYRDDDYSTAFELKGYSRVIKMLHFKVGCVNVYV